MNVIIKSVCVGVCGLTLIAGCSDDPVPVTAGSSAGGSGVGGTNAGGSSAGGESAGGGDAVGYNFPSRFVPGESAVSYSGQTFRLLLVTDLHAYVADLTEQIDGDTFSPTDTDEVMAALDYYYEFDDDTSGEDTIGLSTEPATLQSVYSDVSSGKDIKAKFAGNDSVTDHVEWSTAFVGWSDASLLGDGTTITGPESLLRGMFLKLAELAVDRENGTVPKVPGTDQDIAEVYVTADGLDLSQLTQKLLLVGMAYAQGTDDYLDDDVVDKGLLSSNAQDGDNPYSVLGHAWDEAWGYFGAARDYALYTDDEIASKGGRDDWQGLHDSDGDDKIDLRSEINFAASVNAAKRDRGSDDSAKTDYTKQAYDAFFNGRAIIVAADDSLEAGDLEALSAERDKAVDAWERAIAATIVHYINEVLVDMQAFGGDDYAFLDHAKHWSELKGFALGLQFNPRMTLSSEDFVQLHVLIGDKPVLSTATSGDISDYQDALEAARDLLKNGYGFADANALGW